MASCIPLHLAHPCSENAVRKRKALLVVENFEGDGELLLAGIYPGAPTAVVVPLVGDIECFLAFHLQKTNDIDENRAVVNALHEVWFGIVDGCILHGALS